MKDDKKTGLEKNVLSRTVFSEQIRDIIADSILNGELKAGDRVAENNLARKLGVSQAPVRDAIRDLVFMGLDIPRVGEEEKYVTRLEELSDGLKTTVFVRNSEEFAGEMI